MPDLAVTATAELVDRLPVAGEAASWVHAVRTPVLLKTDRAKKKLRWKPKYTGRQTLKELVAARRDRPPSGN